MPRRDREPSSVKLTMLDLSDVEDNAVRYLNVRRAYALADEAAGGKSVNAVDTGWDWAVCDTPTGLYVLCSEGVGPDGPVTDEEPFDVDLYVRSFSGQDEHQFISMMPSAHVALGPDEVRKRMTGKEVFLHDFVRQFGARLETNYSIWRRTLEKALSVRVA